MKAYQYFHLLNGYAAKTSDMVKEELQIAEELRKNLTSLSYFACFSVNGTMYLLNAGIDESKNQLIRGRIAKPEELNALPINYIQGIPDMRLFRFEMPLIARPYNPPAFRFEPYPLDGLCLARAFEAVMKKEDVVLGFNNEAEAVLTLKTLLHLLPLDFARKVGFVIADAVSPFHVDIVDSRGNKAVAEAHLCLLTRPLTETEKHSYKCIDFVSKDQELNGLSSAATMIYSADLTRVGELEQLKSAFEAFIDENGINEYIAEAAKKEHAFAIEPNAAHLADLVALLPNLPPEQGTAIVYRLANTFAEQLNAGEMDPSLFESMAGLRSYPEFEQIVSGPYAQYLTNHFLALEGQALDDFALALGRDNALLDSFLSDAEAEENNRRKAKRLAVLLGAVYYGANFVPNDVTIERYVRLMRMVDIANCYQLLSYNERKQGEDIFYGINEEGQFADSDIDRLAFLLYSAYLPSADIEWRKMRLKGLEVRLKPLGVLEKLRVLIKIKDAIERYGAILYTDDYALSDLNGFYLDVYADAIRTELKKSDYRARIAFYDEFRASQYLGLVAMLVESLCDLPAFASAYPDLTREQTSHFLSLFRNMPQNKACLEMVNHLSLIAKEAEMNENFASFRMAFVKRCYNALPRDEQAKMPPLPEEDDMLSVKTEFTERIDTILAGYEGETNLAHLTEIPAVSGQTMRNLQQNGESVSAQKRVISESVTRKFVYAYLTYKESLRQTFEVKVSLESEEETELPSLLFIACRRNPESDPNCVTVYRAESIQLKKSLFNRRPHASVAFDCPLLESGNQIFVLFEDRNAPFLIRTIRNKK